MSNSVSVESAVAVSSDVAFAYLSDYTKIADWLYGLSELKALTEQTRGIGAKFDGTIKLGAKLQSLLEVVEFEEGRLMVLDSYKGIKNASRWEVTPTGDASCTIKVTWEYDLGGGIAGKALGKVVEPVVKIAASASTKSLKEKLEG
ncbi:SRPBCC family protein [Nocardioides jiangxiensis]|uniref:SRPBCC family protein n=1 Tax=Nocardioides jiangxiensis TaxID=3064524 RepID=A0ABT9AZU1_9ACTN|nr:SRPBCC family protein [Nocardioides sp. WY-20]MDO7868114.1 SRPBCC family protein [Nocardioides sp. WY-20]